MHLSSKPLPSSFESLCFQVDKYGTVGPHTIIRQHMDYGHWSVLTSLSSSSSSSPPAPSLPLQVLQDQADTEGHPQRAVRRVHEPNRRQLHDQPQVGKSRFAHFSSVSLLSSCSSPRLQRHFATFSVVFPGADALFTIYNSILRSKLFQIRYGQQLVIPPSKN